LPVHLCLKCGSLCAARGELENGLVVGVACHAAHPLKSRYDGYRR
jgi:hypothetical protein